MRQNLNRIQIIISKRITIFSIDAQRVITLSIFLLKNYAQLCFIFSVISYFLAESKYDLSHSSSDKNLYSLLSISLSELRMRLLQIILLCLLSLSWSETGPTRSPKKGLVIPSWPKHFCYDFEAFTTIRSRFCIFI